MQQSSCYSWATLNICQNIFEKLTLDILDIKYHNLVILSY